MWDQELEELLVGKPFPVDPPYDHLGKENLWSVQLQQDLLENDEQKELEDQELEEKNFDKSFQKKIFLKKLDALLLEMALCQSSFFTSLLASKHGRKYREASKEISFDKKKGDKELPHQLRRLRSALTATRPSKSEQLQKKQLCHRAASTEKQLDTEADLHQRAAWRKHQLDRESSLPQKQLDKKQLDKEQLDRAPA